MRNWRFGVAGLLAGLAGLGTAQVVAILVDPGSAPVLAVGSAVIDLTPQPVKQWAITTFGTADKIFLLSVIGAIATALFCAAGLLSRSAVRRGALIIGALGAACVVAAATRASATVLWVVPAVIAAVVAIAALILLRRALGSSVDRPVAEANGSSRRAFLKVGSATALVGAASLVAGQWLIANAQKVVRIALPKPAAPLPDLPAGLDSKVPGITAFRTPNEEFYRVDTALTVPSIDPQQWRLVVDGDVENPLVLSFGDLAQYEVIERDITMTCVSNEVGGPYVGAARWLGVRVSDVLADAGIADGVDQILSTDVDGMTISTPIEALTDDREALLAFGMNGTQLPRERGFPVRLVTPRLYGFVGSTKWLTTLTATTYAEKQAYWTERDWDIDGTIHTQARIDVPKPLEKVAAGEPGLIGGVAWAQGRGISQVEIQIDDGDWQQATLGPDAGIDYWRQWYLPWVPTPGNHTLRVRATDGTGETQTDQEAAPFPGGATGRQSLVVQGA